MKLCDRCPRPCDNPTTLCTRCRDKKRIADRRYDAKPEVKLRKSQQHKQYRESNKSKVKKWRETAQQKAVIYKHLTETEHKL